MFNKKHNLHLYNSGSKDKYYLIDIIKILSNKNITFIKIPIFLITITLKLFNLLRINYGFSYDNLLGLINYNNRIKINKNSKHSIYS